jgi:hypothetical protein
MGGVAARISVTASAEKNPLRRSQNSMASSYTPSDSPAPEEQPTAIPILVHTQMQGKKEPEMTTQRMQVALKSATESSSESSDGVVRVRTPPMRPSRSDSALESLTVSEADDMSLTDLPSSANDAGPVPLGSSHTKDVEMQNISDLEFDFD